VAIDRAFPCCSGDRSYDRDHSGNPVPDASTVVAPTLAAPTSLSEFADCVDGGSLSACRRSQGLAVSRSLAGWVSWPETSPSSRRRRARG
jgi:hypothetical protein